MEQKIMKSMTLFANGGIGEYYLRPEKDNNGNDVFPLRVKNVLANELIFNRCLWYQSIYPYCNVIPGSIESPDVFNKLVELGNQEQIEFLQASPPCQKITIANNNKNKGNDPINRLVLYALDIIRQVPTIKRVLFENAQNWFSSCPGAVPELKGRNIGEFLCDELRAMGFKYIHKRILNAADFGTPQNRKRSILIASKDVDWEWPKEEDKISLKTAISHLPSLEAGEFSDIPFHDAPVCSPKIVEIMRHTPTGKSAWENTNPLYRPTLKNGRTPKEYCSAYSRNDWDKPCCAILMKSKSNGGMRCFHPGNYKGKDENGDDIYSDARNFTIRELLIICGLPEDYPTPDFAANNDQLIRDILGESFAPQLVKRLIQTMPK